MKKSLSFVLAICLLFCLPFSASGEGTGFGGLLSSVQQNYQPQEELALKSLDPDAVLAEAAGGKALTLMIYMCGSNLESMPQSSASKDIEEIIDSDYSTKDVNLLLMPGGARRWHISNINGQETGIYCIRPDGITKLWESDKQLNMGDPLTLSFFLHYGFEYFPAQKYALIVWDHGGGAIGGVCVDENSGDSLSLPELKTAMEASPAAREKLEWIGFDACLMASAEVALLLSPYAGFMIASEETEPGYGWDYHFLKGIETESSGAETGVRIIEHYLDWYEKQYPGCDVTLSCIDLSAVSELADQLERFFAEMAELVGEEDYSEISRAVRRAVFFGNVDESASEDTASNARVYDLADLGSLIGCLDAFVQADGKQLIDYLNSRVVVKTDNNIELDISGLTLYHPLRAKKMYSANIKSYRELSVLPNYVNYIQQFGKILLEKPAASFSGLLGSFLDSGKVKRALIVLPLSEEQQRSLARAELVILQRGDKEDSYHFVSASDSVFLDDSGVLRGELIHRNLFLTDESGEPLRGVPPLRFSQNESGQYVLPVTVCSTDPQTGEMTRNNACLVCEESGDSLSLRVVSVLGYDTLTECYTPRLSLDLSLAEAIGFDCVDRVPTRDETGALLGFDQWEAAGTSSFSWSAEENYQLRFLENRLEEDSICVAFSLTDTQSNSYLSELISLTEPVEEGVLQLVYDDKDQLVTLQNPRCEVQSGTSLLLTAEISNICEEELLVTLSDLTINGVKLDAETEVFGMGPHDGLEAGEKQILLLMAEDAALAEMTAVETLCFDLLVRYAGSGEEAAVIPVTGTANLPLR